MLCELAAHGRADTLDLVLRCGTPAEWTPAVLDAAARLGRAQVAALLIDRRPAPLSPRALDIAIQHGHPRVVSQLVAAGARLPRTVHSVKRAAAAGHFDTVRLCVELMRGDKYCWRSNTAAPVYGCCIQASGRPAAAAPAHVRRSSNAAKMRSTSSLLVIEQIRALLHSTQVATRTRYSPIRGFLALAAASSACCVMACGWWSHSQMTSSMSSFAAALSAAAVASELFLSTSSLATSVWPRSTAAWTMARSGTVPALFSIHRTIGTHAWTMDLGMFGKSSVSADSGTGRRHRLRGLRAPRRDPESRHRSIRLGRATGPE
nr:hypothetical protein HK105_000220 [Polyrhizophydium stewartii]